jgi:hypothetical protein
MSIPRDLLAQYSAGKVPSDAIERVTTVSVLQIQA